MNLRLIVPVEIFLGESLLDGYKILNRDRATV